MGAFGLLLPGALRCLGLLLSARLGAAAGREGGHAEAGNRVSGNAMFTEVPHDMTAYRGQDVEMACSFRGAGTPSYLLEIQWWYIRNRRDWTENQPWTGNEVAPEEGLPKDATKISVVKVAGSNISHKLRLSAIKPTDEGIYECRVIDFSDGAGARHHHVRASLRVVPRGDASVRHDLHDRDPAAHGHGDNFDALPDATKHGVAGGRFGDGDAGGGGNVDRPVSQGHLHHGGHHQEHSKQPHHAHSHSSSKAGRELKKTEVEHNTSPNDCPNEPSCLL